MNFNEEIKGLVDNRNERLNKEFEFLTKRCLELLYKNSDTVRVYVYFDNPCLGVIDKRNLIDKYSYTLGIGAIPLIYNKYFQYVNDRYKNMTNFLRDFEYYLYMNTDFKFYEIHTSDLGFALCVELPENK